MKITPSRIPSLALFLAVAFAAPLLRAADAASSPPDKDMDALTKQIAEATDFYKLIELKPETLIPDGVVAKAKGVLILNLWSGSVGIGGAGGSGIGMRKNKDGKFSAPAFYNLSGLSIGIQIGGGNTRAIAFLMSDKALTDLTDSKVVFGGDIRAVAGPKMASATSPDESADVILYQQTSGLDIGVSFAGMKISVNETGNRKFYSVATLTPTDIFDGKVKVPAEAKDLVDSLNKQAAAAAKK